VETAEKDPLEDLKVGAAKLVISLLPNEGGLRWVGGLLPSKFKSTFDGLVTSYKNQMMLALKGDEERAGKALTSIFKDMLTAYSGQIIGTPFDFPSHHLAIREPFDYYQASLYFNSLVRAIKLTSCFVVYRWPTRTSARSSSSTAPSSDTPSDGPRSRNSSPRGRTSSCSATTSPRETQVSSS
jgi:hypothetical protein